MKIVLLFSSREKSHQTLTVLEVLTVDTHSKLVDPALFLYSLFISPAILHIKVVQSHLVEMTILNLFDRYP